MKSTKIIFPYATAIATLAAALIITAPFLRAEDSAEISRKKKLIRLFGTSGYTYYAHLRHKERLKVIIKYKGEVIDEERTTFWKPKDLVGKFKDVTHCDVSNEKFSLDDKEGYISFYALSPEELKLWREIQNEKRNSKK